MWLDEHAMVVEAAQENAEHTKSTSFRIRVKANIVLSEAFLSVWPECASSCHTLPF